MMVKLIRRYVKFLSRQAGHRWVLAFTVILTLLALHVASGLRIMTDLALLLPSDSPIIRQTEQVFMRVGSTGELLVELKSPSREANLAFMELAAPKLRELPQVHHVLYHQDPAFFEQHALLYLEKSKLSEIEQRVRDRIQREVGKRMDLFGDGDEYRDDEDEDGQAEADDDDDDFLDDDWRRPSTGYQIDEYFISDDGTVALMKVQPTGTHTDIDFCKELVGSVTHKLESLQPDTFHPHMQFSLSGDYVNNLGELDSIKGDILWASLLCLIVICVLLVIFFRQLRATFIILLPLGMGAIWTLAMGRLLVGSLNVVSGFIVAILLGLGIDIGIHFYSRYRAERRDGQSKEEALTVMLTKTGRAALTATITTSVTFFTLLVADFRGFTEFGIMAGVGIVLCLVAMVTAFPSLLVFTERIWPLVPAAKSKLSQNKSTSSSPKSTDTFHIKSPRTATVLGGILLVGLGVAAFGMVALPRVPFEFDFAKLMRRSAGREERDQQTRELRESGGQTQRDILGGATTASAIALVDSLEEAQELHQALEGLRSVINPDNDRPYLERFLTIWHFVPEDQEDKLTIIRRIRRLVNRRMGLFRGEQKERAEELATYLEVDAAFGPEDLPDWVKTRFSEKNSDDFGRFAMVWGWGHKENYLTTAKLYEVFGHVPLESGKVIPVTANYFILKDVIDMAARDGKRVFFVAAFAVFFILLADFRSLRKVLLSFGTVMVGFLWTVGLLYLLDMKWSFFNLCILPTIIGMGIDDSVHFIHRYEEEGPGGVVRVIRGSGIPIILTTVTTMAGFTGMMFADHYGLNSLGTVAVAGLVTACIATLTVLPAYLLLEEYLVRKKQKGRPAAKGPQTPVTPPPEANNNMDLSPQTSLKG